MKSSIYLFEIINIIVPCTIMFFWTPASIAKDVDPYVRSSSFANGVTTFSANGKVFFINWFLILSSFQKFY